MLRLSIGFFVIGLLALFFGMNHVAGVSIELGRLLLFVFLVLAMISFLVSLTRSGGSNRPSL